MAATHARKGKNDEKDRSIGLLYNTILTVNIERIRKEQGLTKQALAQEAGLSNSFLSAVLTAGGNPSLSTIIAIAVALKADPIDLLISPDLGREGQLELLFADHGGRSQHELPAGFTRLPAGVLTQSRAVTVQRWIDATRPFLKRALAQQKAAQSGAPTDPAETAEPEALAQGERPAPKKKPPKAPAVARRKTTSK